jgi:hypothetical protein
MPKKDPVHEYIDERIDLIRKELTLTNRQVAKLMVSMTSNAVILNLQLTSPAKLKKITKTISTEATEAMNKIDKSENPIYVASEFSNKIAKLA